MSTTRTNTAQWMPKHNRWQIKVQKDGIRKAFYSSTPGRTGQREANAKADAFLSTGIVSSSRRVRDLWADWFNEVQSTTSIGNWRPLQSRAQTWILPNIGHIKISNLTEQHLQSVINKAAAKNLSRKTLNNILSDLQSFLKYCRRSRICSLYSENVSVPKSATYKAKTILQPSDLIKLFNCTQNTFYGKLEFDSMVYAYRFQILTGLRPGELMGLQWSDIHGRTLYVQRSINTYGEITTGKNNNAIRHFVLSDLAYSTLQSQRALTGRDIYIFDRLTNSGYLKRWQKFCKANHIAPITLYEMRHTFISIAKKLPEGIIKPIVGHSQNFDTFGIYGHALDGEDTTTATAINSLFENLLNNKVGY